MFKEKTYYVYYSDDIVAYYVVKEDGFVLNPSSHAMNDGVPEELKHRLELPGRYQFIEDIISEEPTYMSPLTWERGDISVSLECLGVSKRLCVYRWKACKGIEGYSEKDHTAAWNDNGDKCDPGKVWCLSYSICRMEDGATGVELDEASYSGGSHYDGGVMTRIAPAKWKELPYEQYLEKLLTLAQAKRFRFSAEDLLAVKGLKEFLGY